MAKKTTSKKFDVIVNGLDNLDLALKAVEDRTKGFDEAYPKLKKKEGRRKTLYIALGACIYIALEWVFIESQSSTLFIFLIIFGLAAIVLLATIKPSSKADRDKAQNEEQKKMIDYINTARDNIDLLLEKKDILYDFYITPSQNEHFLVYIAPEKNDKGEETGVFHSIYINEFKIINNGKYSTLTIESHPEWAIGYKTILELPYALFKESATWLR